MTDYTTDTRTLTKRFTIEITKTNKVLYKGFDTMNEAQREFDRLSSFVNRVLGFFSGRQRIAIWNTIYDTNGNEVAWEKLADTHQESLDIWM